MRAVRRIGRWTRGEWLGLVSLIALAAAIFVGFARQMAPISTAGVYADPHGRYLFVLMIPIVWLLLAGGYDFGFWILGFGRRAVRPKSGAFRASATSLVHAGRVPWRVWAWASAVVLFTAYCLLSLIGPYYYG